jgi:hypothetical protein
MIRSNPDLDTGKIKVRLIRRGHLPATLLPHQPSQFDGPKAPTLA